MNPARPDAKGRVAPGELDDDVGSRGTAEVPDVRVEGVRLAGAGGLTEVRWLVRCLGRVDAGEQQDVRALPELPYDRTRSEVASIGAHKQVRQVEVASRTRPGVQRRHLEVTRVNDAPRQSAGRHAVVPARTVGIFPAEHDAGPAPRRTATAVPGTLSVCRGATSPVGFLWVATAFVPCMTMIMAFMAAAAALAAAASVARGPAAAAALPGASAATAHAPAAGSAAATRSTSAGSASAATVRGTVQPVQRRNPNV